MSKEPGLDFTSSLLYYDERETAEENLYGLIISAKAATRGYICVHAGRGSRRGSFPFGTCACVPAPTWKASNCWPGPSRLATVNTHMHPTCLQPGHRFIKHMLRKELFGRLEQTFAQDSTQQTTDWNPTTQIEFLKFSGISSARLFFNKNKWSYKFCPRKTSNNTSLLLKFLGETSFNIKKKANGTLIRFF